MNKTKAKGSFLDNKRNVLILSIAIALVAWIIVAVFINPNQEKTVEARITYSTGSSNYRNRGLEIVGDTQSTAFVTVRGDDGIARQLTGGDVTVYCDYSNVLDAGPYNVPLRADVNLTGNYDILDIDPPTVSLTFETTTTSSFTLRVIADGISVPEGYYKDVEVLSNLNVEVTGPETAMAEVAEAVVIIPDEVERTENYVVSDAEVQLRNAAGEIIQNSLISIEPATVDVEFPILLKKSVPITVGVIGGPQSFDAAWFISLLSYSEETIQVAGNAAALDQVTGTLNVGTVDVSTFTLDSPNTWVVVGDLPYGLSNMNNIQQIEVTLDTETLASRTMEIPNDNVVVNNAPAGLTVEPVDKNGTYEVTLVGPANVINSLTVDNVVVEIDASGVTAANGSQQRLAARVYVPRSNRVYAVESYEGVLCRVQE